MKKQKFNGKLKLNKEVISKLNNESMSNVVGGNITNLFNTCTPCMPTGTNIWQCTVGGCDPTFYLCE